MDIAIIPAYNPDQKLVELVKELSKKELSDIIVVNDGSEGQTLNIFEQLKSYATILTHDVNKGKGAALKTALQYVLDTQPKIQGIVFLDADGQHHPKDAMHLLTELHNSRADMILGVRSFEGKIPFRSRFGNTITKYVFRLCSGKWVSDTQTGLRAISPNMVIELLNVSGDRYEYEMNVLLSCAKNNTVIKEVPIATVYHDESNSCSHFRAVRDSARIYGNLLAFSGASFVSFLLDYLLFFPFVQLFGLGMPAGSALILGNIAARIISAAFNYYLNSTFIFRSKKKRWKSIVSYALLACLILTLNSVILFFLNDLLGLNKALAKLITEMTLFAISFTVQKFLIFNKVTKEEVATL